MCVYVRTLYICTYTHTHTLHVFTRAYTCTHCTCVYTYSRGQKKVPVPFPYNGRSTFIRFKKNVVKTLNERACAVRTLTFF